MDWYGGPTVLGFDFRGRVFMREVPPAAGGGASVNFGISKTSTSTVTYTAEAYPVGATYLLVMKYTFNAGADDDTVDLYVFEARRAPARETLLRDLGVGRVAHRHRGRTRRTPRR